MCMFRALNKNDVEVRVQSCTEKGAVLLLYKNARVDMNILDETVGQERWQREHYEVKGNLYCRIGIYFDTLGWVWKSDCGTESNTEAEKGEASDSFKRAGTNWGIGRALYTSPFIFGKAGDINVKQNGNKYGCYDKFDVTEYEETDGKITKLAIYDNNTKKTVFTYGISAQKAKETPKPTENAPKPAKPAQSENLPFPDASGSKGAMTLEEAKKFHLTGGQYNGELITDVYKKDKQYLMTLVSMPGTAREVIDAFAALELAVAAFRK